MPTVTLAHREQYEAAPGTLLLDATLSTDWVPEHSCKTGRCSSCKARVVSGPTKRPRPEDVLGGADFDQGGMLSCERAAVDDVALDNEDLGDNAENLARIQRVGCVLDDVVNPALRLPPTAQRRRLPGQCIDAIGPGLVERAYSIANAALGAVCPLEPHIRAMQDGRMSAHWFGNAQANDLPRIDDPRDSSSCATPPARMWCSWPPAWESRP